MKKRLITGIITLTFLAATITGCAGTKNTSTPASKEPEGKTAATESKTSGAEDIKELNEVFAAKYKAVSSIIM
jgi:ABC-type phosphate transport system substrate-binding protein